jgi:putative nucleotidyltransferase with HDIG domain
MTLELRFFKSRLALRFFGLFLVCTLVPILALTIVVYYWVSDKLSEQSLDRLKQSAKSFGLSIHEHLSQADYQLSALEPLVSNKNYLFSREIQERNKQLFTRIDYYADGRFARSWGDGDAPTLDAKIFAGVEFHPEHRVVLLNLDQGKDEPRIAVVRKVVENGRHVGMLLGILNPEYLSGQAQGSSLPPLTYFVLRDEHGGFLTTSRTEEIAISRDLRLWNSIDSRTRKDVPVVMNDRAYFVGSWSIFLKPRFNCPSWEVTLLEPRDYVLGPMRFFWITLLAVTALSIVAVTWASGRAIRKSLIPIDGLMEGARQVSLQNFEHRVAVTGKDEFHDLATVFNQMTSQLNGQFHALAARADLDRAVLSVLEMDAIVATGLEWVGKIFPVRSVAISILSDSDPREGKFFICRDENRGHPIASPFRMTEEENNTLTDHRDHLLTEDTGSIFSSLRDLHSSGFRSLVVFPIHIQDRLLGFLSVGGEDNLAGDVLHELRKFVDHLAVAFSNSHLVAELRDLNIGTLRALARTVDAKSSWTAGHSQRVTEMAVDVGMAMELSDEMVNNLQRAALLHDIGKIGIPVPILDKPAKLTDGEYDTIKSHPSVGARILDPIKVYAPIVPFVEQHHERYDGKGYPHGVRGGEISLGARILAVADAFDAMVSDRPYRKGLPWEEAVSIVRSEAGYQFDPEIVEVFDRLIPTWKRTIYRPEEKLDMVFTNSALMAVADSGRGRLVDRGQTDEQR